MAPDERSGLLAAKVRQNLEGVTTVLRMGVQHGQAAVDLARLRLGERNGPGVEAIPKRLYEIEAFLLRQMAEVEGGHDRREMGVRQIRCKTVTGLHIPDDFAERLGADGDVARQAPEALALEAYRSGRLTRAEMRRLLGFGASPALDAFLVVHDVAGTFTETDLARDRQDLGRLGL